MFYNKEEQKQTSPTSFQYSRIYAKVHNDSNSEITLDIMVDAAKQLE